MRRRDWKTEGRQKVKAASQGDLWKPVEGTNYFRVLPNKRGLDHSPYQDWGLHRDVGPDNALLRCGMGTEADSCWLCNQLTALVARDPSKRTVAEVMARSDQLVVQILPIDVETQQPGAPRAWWLKVGGKRSMGIRLMSFLTSTARDYDDPAKGYNVSLDRTGTGPRNTEYGPFEPDQDPSSVDKSVRGQMKHLEELIPAYNAADQKAAYLGHKRVTADDRGAESQGEWGGEEEDPAAGGGRTFVESAPRPEDVEAAGDDWGGTDEADSVSGGDEGKDAPAEDPADDESWDWSEPAEPEPKPPPKRTAARPAAKRTGKPEPKKAPAKKKKTKPTAKHVAKRRR